MTNGIDLGQPILAGYLRQDHIGKQPARVHNGSLWYCHSMLIVVHSG